MSSPRTTCFRLCRRCFIRKSGAWDKWGHIMERLRFNISKMNWTRGLKFHYNYILQMFSEIKNVFYCCLICGAVNPSIWESTQRLRRAEFRHTHNSLTWLSHPASCPLSIGRHSIMSVARSIKHVIAMFISCRHNTVFNHKSSLITAVTCTYVRDMEFSLSSICADDKKIRFYPLA